MDVSFLWLLLGVFTLVKGTQIKNARAIVTGGANGIGYHCVHDLLSRGAKAVAILDYDVVNGTMATQKLMNKFGNGRVFYFPTDVSHSFEFEVDFWMAVQLLGGLDIMINDAGIVDENMCSQEIDTNLKGEIQGTLMSVSMMGKHKGGKGGTVVNIASTTALMAFKYFPIYDATKEGVLGFSTSIALSYNVTGVAVKTMCPGATDTHLTRSKAHRYLDFIDYDEVMNAIIDMPRQKPEKLSREIMRLIEEAPNGAIWVVEPNEPTISLNIPNYREWGTPV